MTDRSPRFHLALNVAQARFDAMIAFYATLFGAAPAKRKPDYAKFDLREPPVNFTFNAVPETTHGEINHLGIQVWSDAALFAARDRLRAAGLAVREEINVECCYAGQNKFWVQDPDGREVEFFHVLHDIETHGKRRLATLSAPAAADACCGPGEDCT
jgi:catechol 2,3-dioxygenase-like lactoylglutathione lyase family enzyme